MTNKRYAFHALRYFAEQGTLTNQYVIFQEDFNGKAFCGIEDMLYCGKWMLYYEPIDDVRNGYRVNPDLIDGDRAADRVTYSSKLKCKVYLWELNPPSKKCLKCKCYIENN